jgi:hypothetical protein
VRRLEGIAKAQACRQAVAGGHALSEQFVTPALHALLVGLRSRYEAACCISTQAKTHTRTRNQTHTPSNSSSFGSRPAPASKSLFPFLFF